MPWLDLSNFNIVCSVLGGFFMLYNLCSHILKDHFYLSDPLVTFGIGVALGPYAASFVRPELFGSVEAILLEFARLTLAVSLVLCGVQLPNKYLRLHWRSLFSLLLPVMAMTWLISGTIMYLVIPGISYVDALALGACVTPTDPVLSMSIVKGRYARKYVPQHLRVIISAEAGANDGLGYPYLFLALYLSQYATGAAIGRWVYETWLYSVLLGVLYGAFVGYLFSTILQQAEKRSFADRESVQVYGIVVAIFLLGTCGMLGIDDLLACFVAGNVFTWNDWFREVTRKDALQSTIDYLLNATFFAFLGAMMPWQEYKLQFMASWRYIVIALSLLIFKRLPPVLILYRIVPQIRSVKEAAFVGYFGPVGVAAIYYSGIVVRYLEERPGELSQSEEMLRSAVRPVIYSVVVTSIIVHGLSIPLYKFLGHLPDSVRHPMETMKAHWRPQPRLRLLEFEEQINTQAEK